MQFLNAESEEVIDMLREQSPILEKAVERLIYVSADEKLRFELEMREKAELEYMFRIDTRRQKGLYYFFFLKVTLIPPYGFIHLIWYFFVDIYWGSLIAAKL